jgi:DNA-binding transcriptional LysR family regulator
MEVRALCRLGLPASIQTVRIHCFRIQDNPLSQDAADLNALLVFAAVAEHASFSAAAEQLGLARAKVSVVIARLEAQLGQTLFARTTRRVALTAAGQSLYERGVPPLRAVQEALSQFGGEAALGGTLRIAAPLEYAAQTASRAVAAFAAASPGLEVDLRASDQHVDLLKEGVDVALRLGWLRDSSLRAMRLGDFDQHVVAAPAYLKRAPRLAQPADLARHEWVALTLMKTPLTWKFTSARGQARTVRVSGRVRTNAVGALRGLLEAGAGLSVMDEFSAARAIAQGTLVRVLPQWALPRGGIHAVFPPGRFVPAKARAFAAFYKDWLTGQA